MLPGLSSAIVGAGGGSRPLFVGGQVSGQVGASGTLAINFSLTGGLASTPAEGDLVIVAMAHNFRSNADWTISGYTEISDLWSPDFNNGCEFALFYKFMTGTPDTSVTVPRSGNAAVASAYAIHVWRGVNATPLDVSAVNATGIDTPRANPGAITPVTSGSIIIVAGGGASETGAADFTSSDLENFISTWGNDDYDAIVGMGSYPWVSGAFDPAQWGGPSVQADSAWAATTIALRPA
jgi:hypothetical protein